MCLAYAGSASCSSLLIFSLSLSGVRPGVKPGVTDPRGVIPPPAWGVMPSCPWPGPGVLLERTWPWMLACTVPAGLAVLHQHRGGGVATWTVCWEQCWVFGSAAAEVSLHWSRSHAAVCWGLLSEGCQCWSEPSGSGLPGNPDTGSKYLTQKVSWYLKTCLFKTVRFSHFKPTKALRSWW